MPDYALPMQVITDDAVEAYLKDDTILSLMTEAARGLDANAVCHKWLLGSEPKRTVYELVYHGALSPKNAPQRILDVGGGLTSLTRRLAINPGYRLSELFAHDNADHIAELESDTGNAFVIKGDWYEADLGAPYELIIANDIFPNVDQRLSLFLERALPLCRELRLSLTFYNTPRFYKTQRVDAEEILFLLAWNGAQTHSVLEPFKDRITDWNPGIFTPKTPSVYANGRHLAIVQMRGDLA